MHVRCQTITDTNVDLLSSRSTGTRLCTSYFITLTSQWAAWHQKPPAARRFIQLFVQANIKYNTHIKENVVRATGLCEGNPSITGGFPLQMAGNAESVSIAWRHNITWENVLCKIAVIWSRPCAIRMSQPLIPKLSTAVHVKILRHQIIYAEQMQALFIPYTRCLNVMHWGNLRPLSVH